jgi:hypothetical protein
MTVQNKKDLFVRMKCLPANLRWRVLSFLPFAPAHGASPFLLRGAMKKRTSGSCVCCRGNYAEADYWPLGYAEDMHTGRPFYRFMLCSGCLHSVLYVVIRGVRYRARTRGLGLWVNEDLFVNVPYHNMSGGFVSVWETCQRIDMRRWISM